MEIGIEGRDDLFAGNVVCNRHYFELACSVVYGRWDGRVTRTFSGTCSEYVSQLQRRYRDIPCTAAYRAQYASSLTSASPLIVDGKSFVPLSSSAPYKFQ